MKRQFLRSRIDASGLLILAALTLPLGMITAPALANGIQMLPPVTEATKTYPDANHSTPPTVCPVGTAGILTWDGTNPVSCATGVTVTGGNVGIGMTTEANANLEIASPFGSNTPGSALMMGFTAGSSEIFGVRRSAGNDALVFDAFNYQNAWEPVLSIERNGGLVGIGTMLPAATLDVEGGVQGNYGVILNAGNVGIGTTGPGYPLEVVRADNATTDIAEFYPNNLTIGVGIDYNGIHEIGSAGGQALRLDSQGAGDLLLQTNGGTGNVGIEMTNPQAALDVYASDTGLTQSNAGGLTFRVMDGLGRPAIATYGDIDGTPLADDTATALAVRDVSGTGRSITTSGQIYVGGSSNATFPSIITVGSVGIGTTTPAYALDVVGDVRVSGCLHYGGGTFGQCASDARVKRDVVPYALGLDAVVGLNPVTYSYNGLGGNPDDGKRMVGLIAQDVEKAAPQLVGTKRVKLHPNDTTDTEIRTVDYGSLTYLLINSVKEFYGKWSVDHDELAALKADDERLLAAVTAQGREIDALKAGAAAGSASHP